MRRSQAILCTRDGAIDWISAHLPTFCRAPVLIAPTPESLAGRDVAVCGPVSLDTVAYARSVWELSVPGVAPRDWPTTREALEDMGARARCYTVVATNVPAWTEYQTPTMPEESLHESPLLDRCRKYAPDAIAVLRGDRYGYVGDRLTAFEGPDGRPCWRVTMHHKTRGTLAMEFTRSGDVLRVSLDKYPVGNE